jgi:excisionase family DNA binding protein
LITLYTTAEAAEILRVKPSWLERQAAARKIPFTMLGGAYRFSADHLAAIVAMHESPPAPLERSRGARPRRPAEHRPAQATGQHVAPLRARPRSGPRHQSPARRLKE